MPSKLKITLTCGDYEIVRPLKEGRVEAGLPKFSAEVLRRL